MEVYSWVYIFPIYLFSFFDITLTFYQFHLLQKKNLSKEFIGSLEGNLVIKPLIKKFGVNPIILLICFIWVYSVITVLIFLCQFEPYPMGILAGALFVPIMYHLGNLGVYRKNWDNVLYWDNVLKNRKW